MITIGKTSDNGDGTKRLSADTVTTDGKMTGCRSASGRKKIMTMTWSADKKSFTEVINICSLSDPAKVDNKITDTYMLGEDGKTLSLDRKDENNTNGEVWESITLYTK